MPAEARALVVKAGENPHAASVAEALREKNKPERLSMLIAPKPFDLAAFEADPEKYLATVEPGRVMQGRQPGRDVPALRAANGHQFRVEPNGKVALEVKGAQRAPVTFVSADMGTFEENRLNCVTVRADENGVARATFVATHGADGDVNILAGSPMASGQVRFTVLVDSSPLRRPPEDEK